MEIADVGCERNIIIKNYESLNYKWYVRRLAERKKNSSATRSRKKTTRHNKKKDITGTVINTKKIKDAETSILSLNVHRNIQIYIHIEEVNDECYDEGVVVRHEA